MTVKATARRLTTPSGRVIVTDLETVDEVVEFWREKYDRIFAGETKARRTWAMSLKVPKAPGTVEAEIARRQEEWDDYVREQLDDISRGSF